VAEFSLATAPRRRPNVPFIEKQRPIDPSSTASSLA
jgi:hypothetical protein